MPAGPDVAGGRSIVEERGFFWFRGIRPLGRMAGLAGGQGEALCQQLGAVPLPAFPSDTFAALAGGGGRSFPSRSPLPVHGSWQGRLLSVPKSGWRLT